MNEIDREALRAKHASTDIEVRGAFRCVYCFGDGAMHEIYPCPVIKLLDSTGAQLAALRDERDRLKRVLKIVATRATYNIDWVHIVLGHAEVSGFDPDDLKWFISVINNQFVGVVCDDKRGLSYKILRNLAK